MRGTRLSPSERTMDGQGGLGHGYFARFPLTAFASLTCARERTFPRLSSRQSRSSGWAPPRGLAYWLGIAPAFSSSRKARRRFAFRARSKTRCARGRNLETYSFCTPFPFSVREYAPEKLSKVFKSSRKLPRSFLPVLNLTSFVCARERT